MLEQHHCGWSGLAAVGRTDISPPIGIYARCWGAATHDVAEGIHRPLTATVLVLREENSTSDPFVLVGLDLAWWKDAADEWFVRGGLIEALSLDPDRVMVNLAHTHAAPSVARLDQDQPGGEHIAGYLETVRDRTIACVEQALADLRPATLEFSTGRCALARNRDVPEPGTDRYLCGYHPNAGGDDTVLVGRITGPEGTMGTVVNYACHPTTFGWQNRLVSPDFVGAMRDLVEESTGGPCLFLQGASGELAPQRQYTADPQVVDTNGRELGHAVLSTLDGMLPADMRLVFTDVVESGAPLAVWRTEPYKHLVTATSLRRVVDLPLRPGTTAGDGDDLRQADRVTAERLRRRETARRALGTGTVTHMHTWVWRLGKIAVVGQPAEAYSTLQTTLRERFPAYAVVVTNLTNGPHFGYLPPRELYGKDLYQVWQTPLESGGLERTIEAISEAIETCVEER